MSKILTPYINLQSDFGFKLAFGTERNKKALIQFLDAILGNEIKVTDVRFHDKEMLPSSEAGKRIVYDVYCTMDVAPHTSRLKPHHIQKERRSEDVGHHFILEMQNVYEPPFEDRMVYYVAKTLSDQGRRGWNYDLDPVILVAVTDFDFSFLREKLLRDFRLIDKETGEILSEKLRMVFLSLRQLPQEWDDCKTELERIMYLIKNMDKLDKNSEPYKSGGYENMFDAAESRQIAAEDVVLYSQSLERLRSYQAGVDYAAEQSWASGLEKGRAEGRAEGRAQGRVEGRAEGRAEGIELGEERMSVRIARNLLKSGMSKEMVASATGLSLDRIESLE